MAKMGYVKRVFPGNNTPQGFYSFYDQIVPSDARRIMIIKGGPGVGKSTFMSRIGQEMVERGFDVEFHHCSSDNNSLDGVVIPAIGVALIDGTAPHNMDPKNPGAVDEIIHLGDYWDEAKLRAYKEKIMEANAKIASLFSRAYRFLRAAKSIYDDWEAANLEGMDFGLANQKTDVIIREIFHNTPLSSRVGRERHLFASAITPDGMMNYLNTIVDPCKKKYVIEGDPGTGKSTLLQKVARAAIERGFDVEVYHCPLNPEKIEHVVIPERSVALTKSIEPHTYSPGPQDTIVDLNRCLSPEIIARNAEIVSEDKRIFDLLFEKAIHFIGLAKSVHDRMESYYTPCMDFEGITALRERTLARILAYADEAGAKIA